MPGRIRSFMAVALAAAASVAAGVGLGLDPKGALTCVAPLDSAGLDRVLADAGSPLAGEGATFVGAAASSGIDPRALVAIAAHETILQTYPPAMAIHNAFGIGPGRAFGSDAEAIAFTADLLARRYVGDGRRTLAEISGKWAPIGAANDPGNLNANWTTGVGSAYARLGGDPEAPITLDSQMAVTCAARTAAAPSAGVSPGGGAVAWAGAPPQIASPVMEHGADPRSGVAATIPGFVFPLVPAGAAIRYADDFAEPGAPGCYGRPLRCHVTIVAEPNTRVVAATAGTLVPATTSEQDGGLAFWLVAAEGDRIGYSGLAAYDPGIADGSAVVAGQPLGWSTRATSFAWERIGQRINPYPLLTATRASDA